MVGFFHNNTVISGSNPPSSEPSVTAMRAICGGRLSNYEMRPQREKRPRHCSIRRKHFAVSIITTRKHGFVTLSHFRPALNAINFQHS